MYPESLLYWLGGIAVLIGIVGLVGLLAMAVDQWYTKRHKKSDEEEGRRDD